MEFEPLDQFQQRRKKLQRNRGSGPRGLSSQICLDAHAEANRRAIRRAHAEQLAAEHVDVRVAGRIVALRPHGKAAFAHLLGDGARLQIYVKLDVVGEQAYKLFQLLDLGDIVGVSGHLFRTKTNELTIWVEKLELLSKALLPLPEKWHGLADIETALPPPLSRPDRERTRRARFSCGARRSSANCADFSTSAAMWKWKRR